MRASALLHKSLHQLCLSPGGTAGLGFLQSDKYCSSAQFPRCSHPAAGKQQVIRHCANRD